MTAWTLELPWDKPPLSLNDRGQTPGSRRAKSATIQRIRHDVHWLTKAAQIPALTRIHVRLHWQPKMNRRRDSDNLVATLKPCIDALVSAGVIPDDTDEFLDWSRPMIHDAVKGNPRMWLVVTDLSDVAAA